MEGRGVVFLSRVFHRGKVAGVVDMKNTRSSLSATRCDLLNRVQFRFPEVVLRQARERMQPKVRQHIVFAGHKSEKDSGTKSIFDNLVFQPDGMFLILSSITAAPPFTLCLVQCLPL